MSKNFRGYETFAVILILTVVGFFLWLVALLLLWTFLHSMGTNTQFWTMTGALSTAVAAAGVLGAGYVAYRELSEISSSRHIEVADRLFNELNSAENIKARRWIYEHLSNSPEEGMSLLTDEGQAAMKQVLNSLDRVAFLTQGSWIPDEIIMPWMHPMIAKSWAKLEPYVEYERKRRNEPYYYKFASELATRCREWRAKHLVETNVEWVENAL
jgi:hypothetical protein